MSIAICLPLHLGLGLAMERTNSNTLARDHETLIYNAFSHERFFMYADDAFDQALTHHYVDKLAVIDEMLSANINDHTHRSRQE